VICDELTPEHRRAEGNDGQDQSCHVFATLTGGSELRGDSQGCEFVDPSTNAREDLSTNKRIHRIRSAANDHANNDERCSADCHPAAADNV
jgi:hypothetical protein